MYSTSYRTALCCLKHHRLLAVFVLCSACCVRAAYCVLRACYVLRAHGAQGCDAPGLRLD